MHPREPDSRVPPQQGTGLAAAGGTGTWRSRWAGWALSVGVPIVAGIQLVHWLRWAPQKLTIHAILLDDAFFYSVLARNFDRFGFLTLDGEMPTNGVQPLWMLVQIALVKLAPSLSEVSLLAYSSWAFYLLFCFLCVRFLLARGGLGALGGALFFSGALLLNVRFQALVVQGLETPLCLVMIALLLLGLRGAVRATEPDGGPLSRAWVIRLAILGALCFFARTDLFWIPLVVGAWLAMKRKARPVDLLIYAGLVAILVVPYLAHNYLTQGGLMPISGRVKMYYSRTFYGAWPAYFASDEWTGMLHAFSDPFPWLAPWAFVWTPLLFCGALALAFRRRIPRGVRPPGKALAPGARPAAALPEMCGSSGVALRLLGAALLGHVLCMHLLYRVLEPRSAYYFAPELLWVGLVLATGLSWPARHPGASTVARSRRLLRGVAALAAGAALIVAGLAWSERELVPDRYWTKRLDLADDIRELVPVGERAAAFWPGCFAQFSGRLVTPLDGVVGSNEYFQNCVKERRELDYLLERRRPYLATLLAMWPDSSVSPPRWRTWFHQDLPHWTRVGAKRLYERHDELQMALLSARVVSEGEGGWCLLAIGRGPGSPPQDGVDQWKP